MKRVTLVTALSVAVIVANAAAQEQRADRDGDPLPDGAIARLGTRRFHALPASEGAFVRSGKLVLLPDGKTLITGDRNGGERIVVWDRVSGKERRQVVASGGLGAVSPDGKVLAGWTGRFVSVWDIATGKKLVDLEKAPQVIDGLAFSGDGKLLAGFAAPRPKGLPKPADTGVRNKIYRWNVASGKALGPFQLEEGEVTAIALPAAGTALAAGDDRGFLHLLDPAKGETLRKWRAHEEGVLALQFSADGKVLATAGGDDNIRVWDSRSGQKLQEIVPPGPKFKLKMKRKGAIRYRTSVPFALSADGKTLVTAARDTPRLVKASFPAFELWDVATGEKVKLASPPPLGYLQDIAFAADGRVIATLAEGGVISLWVRETGQKLNPIPGHENTVERLAVLPDGKRVVTMSRTNIRFWDVETAKEEWHIAKPSIGGMALSPDGAHLAVVASAGRGFLWDIKQRQFVELPLRFSFAVDLAYSPDGTKLAASNMTVFDTRNWNQLWSAEEKGFRGDVAFSSDGKILATSSAYAVSLLNSANGKLLRRLGGAQKNPALTGGPGGFVRVSNSPAGPSAGLLSGFALSPDGRTVAVHRTVAASSNVVYLWETATGQERGHFRMGEDDPFLGRGGGGGLGRRGGGSALAFSPDGKFLVFGEDSGIHIVDLASGATIRRLVGHRGPVTCLAFSADGRRLFSAGRDTTALVWDMALAGEHVTRDHWQILAGDDAAAAFQAIGELAAQPEKTLPYLQKNLAGFSKRLLAVRALETLERIGTAEARRLLDDYAGNGTVTDLRPQARASVERLNGRQKNQNALATLLQARRQLPPNLRKDQDGNTLPEMTVARLGTTRFRLPVVTPAGNDRAAFLDDTTLLVSGGRAGNLRFVDLVSGQETRRIAQVNPPSDFALSPDGKILAIGALYQNSLWDISSRKLIQTGGAAGSPLAFSPDGKLLAIEGLSRPDQHLKLFLWNVETGGRLALEGSGEERSPLISRRPEQKAAFSPDGKLLAGRTAADEIRLWEVATGEPVRKWPAQGSAISILGFSAGGEVLATSAIDESGRAKIVLWDHHAGKKVRQLTDDKSQPQHAVLSPDGRQLAASSAKQIDVWEVPSGKLIRTIVCPEYPGALAFSRNGQTLASVTSVIRLWDLKSGKQLNPEQGHQARINFLALATDGSTIVTGGGGSVYVWDDKGLARHRFGLNVSTAALSADGKTLAFVSKDLHIRDLSLDKEVLGLPGLSLKNPRLRISPNGRVLAVTDAGTLSFWDLAARSLLWKIEAPSRAAGARQPAARQVAFSSDGKHAAVWDAGSVRLHDAATGKELRVFSQGDGYVSGLALSTDGRSLVVDSSWTSTPFAAGNVRLVILETATGKERFRLMRPSGPFALSADGRFLALGNNRGELQILELPVGKTVCELHANGFLVSSLAFSADGRFLLSGGADTTVLVWDTSDLYRPSSAKKSGDPWTILAGSDAARAYRMIWTLAATPDETVAYLQKQVARHHVRISPAVWKLIAALASDDFKVRAQASAELIKLGPPADLALEKSLEKPMPLETRRRAEQLLEQLRKAAEFTSQQVALLRAFEILEKIGTREAQQLLQTFSREGADARLRAEARTAAARMQRVSRRVPHR